MINEIELLSQNLEKKISVEMISMLSGVTSCAGILKQIRPYLAIEIIEIESDMTRICAFVSIEDGIKKIIDEKGETIFENKELFFPEKSENMRDKGYRQKLFEHMNEQRKTRFGEMAILIGEEDVFKP